MKKDYKCGKCDSKCKSGCVHTSTTCLDGINNCLEYKADGTCGRCGSGYKLENNECKSENSGITNKCDAKTYDGKQCALCQQENYNTGEKTYYYPYSNNQCVKPSQNNNGTNTNNNGTNGMFILLFFVLMVFF